MLSFSAIIRMPCIDFRFPVACKEPEKKNRLDITYSWLIKTVLLSGLKRLLPFCPLGEIAVHRGQL